MTPGAALVGGLAAGAALLGLNFGSRPTVLNGGAHVPVHRHQHGSQLSVPGDLDVPVLELDLGDVLGQARLQFARAHGVTGRFGHVTSVQASGHRDHIVWLQ